MAKYIGDMCVRSGSYKDQNGNDKGRYEKVGTMFENEQGQISMLMTMVPLCNFGKEGGVWLSFFPDKGKQQQQPQQQQHQQPQQQQPQQQPQQQQQQRAWGQK